MFNLIRKDILLQKPTLLILLPLLVVFLFLENSYVWIGIIFSISIVMNAYTIDEKSASHMLLNSLPYTRKEIVSSKYIGTFIFLGIIVSTIFLGNLIIHQEIMMWKDILVIGSSVIVAISFLFPFSYQFKSQYMLIGALVSLAIYLVIIPLFIPDVNDKVKGVCANDIIVANYSALLVHWLVDYGALCLFMVTVNSYLRAKGFLRK